MKRTLREMVAGIRARNDLAEYPKAVMSDAMKEKGTAVINCGDDERKAAKLSEGILGSYEMKLFLDLYKAYGTKAERDLRRNLYNKLVPCVRITFEVRDRRAA